MRRQPSNIRDKTDLDLLLGMMAHGGPAGYADYRAICRAIRDGAPYDDYEVIRAIMDCPDHFASTFTGTISSKLAITELSNSTDIPGLASADATLQFAVGVVEAIASVTAVASMLQALSGGTATVDMTALTHRGVAVSLSGKAVKYFAATNPSANLISITAGASNGNDMLGATFLIVVKPADYHSFKLTASQTVGGSDKTLDLAGTLAQTLAMLFAAG